VTGRIERTSKTDDALENPADLPPVVARLVVEIRSDGTRTIARGALEDRATGQRVELRADSTTPVALARELTRVLLETPVFASTKRAGELVLGLLPAAMRRRLPRPKR
jgi:hypothetical protein